MFTGLVEESGRVVEFSAYCGQHVLRVEAQRVLDGLALGDSIAVNGCCLTVAAREGNVLQFDLLAETRRVTSLAALVPGSRVNLERSLAYGGRHRLAFSELHRSVLHRHELERHGQPPGAGAG